MAMKKEFTLVNVQLSSFDSLTLLLIWRTNDLRASLISYVSPKKWWPEDDKMATFNECSGAKSNISL